MSGPVVQPAVVKGARALACPNCGGTVELRGFAHTRTAVCIQCLSVIDTSSPELRILSRFDERMRAHPLIPLGTRGQIAGVTWETIGFQVRTTWSDGTPYSWHEYLLFNPYQGFRYLVVYNGHWNFVRALPGVPAFTSFFGRKAAVSGGATYRHFHHGVAQTTFVMGEFPWRIEAGEQVEFDDFIAPPWILSCERSDGEVNWSGGYYIAGTEIWKAFKLSGDAPEPLGIAPNQLSPYPQKIRHLWGDFLKLLLLWLCVLVGFQFLAHDEKIFSTQMQLAPVDAGFPSAVTGNFELKSRATNLALEVKGTTAEAGAVQIALINASTGRPVPLESTGREENPNGWSSGFVTGRLDAGGYYVRLEPDSAGVAQKADYDVTVRRDVMHGSWLWLALPLLLIPPIVTTLRAGTFESQRWAESDYGSST